MITQCFGYRPSKFQVLHQHRDCLNVIDLFVCHLGIAHLSYSLLLTIFFYLGVTFMALSLYCSST